MPVVQSISASLFGMRNARAQNNYDVIISDINREENEDEGVRFLSKMRELGLYRWTIFYIFNFLEANARQIDLKSLDQESLRAFALDMNQFTAW
jgi:hypothetical protein